MNGKRMGDLITLTTKTPNMTEPDSATTTLTDMTTNNELEIDVVQDDLYPWAQDDDERRRAFILEYFNWNNDINARIQMESLALIDKWLSGR